MEQRGVKLPKATSTGTTIVGCLFRDGIVLGADTRATEGPIVADKNCEKVRYYSSFATKDLQLICVPTPRYTTSHPLLWCRDYRRHGDGHDLKQHGAALIE